MFRELEMTDHACPVCGEKVAAQAFECPNCGTILFFPERTIESSTEAERAPEEEILLERGQLPGSVEVSLLQATEETAQQESASKPAGKTRKRSKTTNVKTRRKQEHSLNEHIHNLVEPESSAILPVSSSLLGICTNCGHGISDLKQEYCPACGNLLFPANVLAQRDAFFLRAENFISAFDRDPDLPEAVLAYLYRKQVKPALLNEYKRVSSEWKRLTETWIVIAPGYKSPHSEEEILAACRALFDLARLWSTDLVRHYVVLPHDRAESDAYVYDLLARAYQLLGLYHSHRGAEYNSYYQMSQKYNEAQRNYLQARYMLSVTGLADAFATLSSDVRRVVDAGLDLLSMILSYPTTYTSVNDKNPIPSEFKAAFEAYGSYLTIYSSVKELVRQASDKGQLYLQEALQAFQNLTAALEMSIQQEKHQLDMIDEDKKQVAQKWQETILQLDAQGKKILRWTWLMPFLAIVLTASIALLVSSDYYFDEMWAPLLFLVIGSVGFGYVEGLLNRLFRSQVPIWGQILRWFVLIILLSSLFWLFSVIFW